MITHAAVRNMRRHSATGFRTRTRSPSSPRLRDAEVRNRTGLSRTTRWRLVRAGKFPKPVRLTEHAIGWRESAIEEWLASREAAQLSRPKNEKPAPGTPLP